MVETVEQLESTAGLEVGLLRIPIKVKRSTNSSAIGLQPVSFGLPIQRSLFGDSSERTAELLHADGARVPAQLKITALWPDGSVRWLLVDALLPAEAPGGEWILVVNDVDQSVGVGDEITVTESHREIRVQTGAVDFQIDRSQLQLFSRVQRSDEKAEVIGAGRVVLTDAKSQRIDADDVRWRVETAGPIRATIVGEGSFPQMRGLRCELRVSFFAGTGLVRADVALHNPRRAKHRGGIWDLGDAGSLFFRDFSIELNLSKPHNSETVRFSVDAGQRFGSAREVSIYQDSSGGENWNSRNHVNRDGIVPCQFRGYRLNVDGTESTGHRAEPIVQIGNFVSLVMPEFWQQFPKTIEGRADQLRLGLFPQEFDDLHELQGGERKTHTLWLQCDSVDSEFTWVYQPAVIYPECVWCDATGTFPRLDLPKDAAAARFESYLEESAAAILENRETVDEYGWRNFGEIFADHEQTYYTGRKPLISHYNNQFDMVFGFLLQYLRTGDRRWWELGDALARHVAEIDIYHTREDKAAYNGGLFWFTDHYLQAHNSTHRTYSETNRPQNGVYGGGPGAQHNFTTGLLLHYWMTGNSNSREAVLSLADWVIAMDDGRRTIFGIVDDGPTGLSTGGQILDRAGGNSINALVDAWRLTGERRYLEFAEVLVRRCIHPRDDVAAQNLLDIENRWSYTVFLTSLAKFLDAKGEAAELDDFFAYARASFLNYAEWMLENERPYYDQAEKMEFPTEAWAAQEFRKANVLRLAARYAEEPLRSSLLDRGEELADRAWQDLLRFDTRTYARAMAIVMIEGLTDLGFRAGLYRDRLVIDHVREFPVKQLFVSQRQRIRNGMRNFQALGGMVLNAINPQRWLRYRRLRDANGTCN